MTTCLVQVSGKIELYFYDELDARARENIARHLAGCGECQRALEELEVIREALAARPVVDAPPGGDWSGFMARLDRTIAREAVGATAGTAAPSRVWRPSSAWIAMAALLALVSLSVAHVIRSRSDLVADPSVAPVEEAVERTGRVPAAGVRPVDAGRTMDAAFASLSEEHFERSKLVVLGLANRNPETAGREWEHERELASTLLGDTRLYRLAAEERGFQSVADVMGDLELVLLQAAMSRDPEPATLEQIQRLIRKRDLVTRMNVVNVAARPSERTR